MSTLGDSERLNRVCAAARKANWRIIKSVAPDIHLNDFGGFQVVDNSRNCVVFGSNFELVLTDLELIFNEGEAASAATP